jgi:hypothetical protein
MLTTPPTRAYFSTLVLKLAGAMIAEAAARAEMEEESQNDKMWFTPASDKYDAACAVTLKLQNYIFRTAAAISANL